MTHTTPAATAEQLAALMDAMDYDDTRAAAAMLRTLSTQVEQLTRELDTERSTNKHFRTETIPRLTKARDTWWERAQGLAEKVERLEARERACETMQKAEAIALVRMGQELAEALGLDPLGATPAEIVAGVAHVKAEQLKHSATLSELAALREQGQWRPIETAPKDAAFKDGNNHYAAHILAWWPGAIAPTRCRWWFRDDSDACNFLADGGYAVYPTVFQPLPPSPSSTEGA